MKANMYFSPQRITLCRDYQPVIQMAKTCFGWLEISVDKNGCQTFVVISGDQAWLNWLGLPSGDHQINDWQLILDVYQFRTAHYRLK